MDFEEEIERTGSLLIEEGIVFQEEIERILQELPEGLGEIRDSLQDLVCVRRSELSAFIATDYRLPRVYAVERVTPSEEVLDLLTSEAAVKYNAFPVARAGDILLVLMGDPTPEAVRAIRQVSGMRLKVLHGSAEKIRRAVHEHYLKRPVEPVPRAPAETPRSMPAVQVAPARKAETGIKPATVLIPSRAPDDKPADALAAVRIPMEEWQEGDPFAPLMKAVIDWEDMFLKTDPIPAVRIA